MIATAAAAIGMGSLTAPIPQPPEEKAGVIWPGHVDQLMAELGQHAASADQLAFSLTMGGQAASLQDRDRINAEIANIAMEEEEHGRSASTIKRRAAADAKRVAWAKAQDAAQAQGRVITARSYNLKAVFADCEKFTSHVAPGTEFEDARVKAPRGRDDEVLADIRDKLADNAKNAEATENSVMPLEEALARLDGKIRDKAEGVRAEITPDGRDFTLQFPKRRLNIPGVDIITAPNADALFAHYFGDRVREEAEASIKAFYSGFGGLTMTTVERRSELRRLAAERLELHRLECAVIWRHLQAGGTSLYFKEDTPPMAVLGVAKAA